MVELSVEGGSGSSVQMFTQGVGSAEAHHLVQRLSLWRKKAFSLSVYRHLAFFMDLETSSAERRKFLAQALGDNSRIMVSVNLFQVQVLCGAEHSLSLLTQCRGLLL